MSKVKLDLEHQAYLIDQNRKSKDKIVRDSSGHPFRVAHDLVSGDEFVHVAHVIPDADAEGRAAKRRKRLLKMQTAESFLHIPGEGYWMKLEDLKAFEDAVAAGLEKAEVPDEEDDENDEE